MRGRLRFDGRRWWVDTREHGAVAIGVEPDVVLRRSRSLRRRDSGALVDLRGWLRDGDHVHMVAELGARPEGGGYRSTSRYRTAGQVLLTRERSFLGWVGVAALIAIGLLAYAWPQPDQRHTVLRDTSIAMRGNDVCIVGAKSIECTIERHVACEDVYEGRHAVDEECESEFRRRDWMQGAEGVVAAFDGFCGIRGRRIECLDRDLHIVLHEAPTQFVGSRQMVCTRGESGLVACYDPRGQRLAIDRHATRIAAGPHHVCGAGDEGVWCWHAHGSPFLATHLTGHRNLAVASSHVCVRQEGAWCVSFEARDRLPWRMPPLASNGLASRGDEVCTFGADQRTLECSRSGAVPYLDMRDMNARELALAAERACVRDGAGRVRCQAIYSAGHWDPGW